MQTILFFFTLCMASYWDKKYLEVDTYTHLALLLIGLLDSHNVGPVILILNAIIPMIPLLIIYFKNGGIGGGDIKLIGMIGFNLGIMPTLIAVIIGFSVALIKNKNKTNYALVPYITMGCAIVKILEVFI
ncbi:MAG: prepilin peptidase [Oscillospiraceae bacterium]